METLYYKDYINLGFKREDCADDVEFSMTGYGGFALSKKIGKMSIGVSSTNLQSPTLYIPREDNNGRYHLIKITTEIVRALCAM